MSPLWRHVKVLKLHINIQLAPDLSLESRKELAEFAQWVQDINSGKISVQSTANEALTSS